MRLALVVLFAPYIALAAAPTLGPEQSPAIFETGPRIVGDVLQVGSGGPNGAMIGFVEFRAGVARMLSQTRISPAGQPLDVEGTPVADLGGTLGELYAIGWNGTHYLFAVLAGSQSRLWRLTASGAVVDTIDVPFVVRSIASNGADFLLGGVVPGASALSFVRLSASGQLDATVRTIATPPNPVGPAFGWDGTQYIAAWTSFGGGASGAMRYGRIDAQGVPVDTTGFVIESTAADKGDPHVACGNGTCLVIYSTYSGGDLDVRGARVQGATLVGGAAFDVVNTNVSEKPKGVAWDGQNFVSVYELGSQAGVGVARIAAAGGVLSTGALPNAAIAIGVASLGSSAAVVYTTPASQLLHVVVSQTGTLSAPIAPLRSSNTQDEVDVASNGVEALLSWRDVRADGGNSVFAAVVPSSGVVGPPIELASGSGPRRSTRATWTGGSWFVLWNELGAGGSGSIIMGTQVSTAGTVTDFGGRPLIISGAYLFGSDLDLAGTNNQLMIAYCENGNGCLVRRFSAAGVTLDGNALQLGSSLTAIGGGAHAGEFLLAEGEPGGGLAFRRVPPHPAAYGAKQSLGAGHGDPRPLKLTSGPSSFALVTGWSPIWAMTLSSSLGVLGDEPLTTFGANFSADGLAAASSAADHALAFTNTDAVVVARVSPTGMRLDGPELWRVDSPNPNPTSWFVGIGAVGAGEYVVAWSRRVDAQPYSASRVFVRRVSFNGVSFPSGSVAVSLDGGFSADGGSSSDGGAGSDGGSDGGSGFDGGSGSDGGSGFDGGSGSDGGSASDGGVSDGGATSDGGTTADGGASADGGVSLDGGTTADGGVAADGGTNADGGSAADQDRLQLGVGCGCGTGAADLSVLLAWLLLGIAAVRRPKPGWRQ